jgi:hypothetical protein
MLASERNLVVSFQIMGVSGFRRDMYEQLVTGAVTAKWAWRLFLGRGAREKTWDDAQSFPLILYKKLQSKYRILTSIPSHPVCLHTHQLNIYNVSLVGARRYHIDYLAVTKP